MWGIIDIIILIVFSIVVWIMAWTKTKLNKGEGLIMLALYIAYAVYICVRQEITKAKENKHKGWEKCYYF